MFKVDRIRDEILDLSLEELAEFKSWFQLFDATSWDEELVRDSASGKLEMHATEAIAEQQAGRSRKP